MSNAFYLLLTCIVFVIGVLSCSPNKDYDVHCTLGHEITFSMKADTAAQFTESNGDVIAGYYLGGEYFRHELQPNEVCSITRLGEQSLEK